MPDCAIENLLARRLDEIRIPGLEGRFGRKHLDSQDLGVSHWRYAPGTRVPGGHSHREQEEAYVVVAGSGRVRLDDEIRARKSGCPSRTSSAQAASIRGSRTPGEDATEAGIVLGEKRFRASRARNSSASVASLNSGCVECVATVLLLHAETTPLGEPQATARSHGSCAQTRVGSVGVRMTPSAR